MSIEAKTTIVQPSAKNPETPIQHARKASPKTMEGKLYRILIADDHSLMRRGLRCMLSVESDIEIVGEAKNGIEAVDLTARLQPDIILMDISMPAMDGIMATRIIHQLNPDIKIVGLSSHVMDDLGFSIIAAGAVSYICKTDSKENLLKEIRINLPCA